MLIHVESPTCNNKRQTQPLSLIQYLFRMVSLIKFSLFDNQSLITAVENHTFTTVSHFSGIAAASSLNQFVKLLSQKCCL